jgi:hypothetical protein
MNSVHLAAVVFASCNGVRMVAYFPQIVRIVRDRGVCKGVSCLTWGGFAAANLSTVMYALVALGDWDMAAVFGVNLAFCLAIVLLTCWKRVSVQRSDQVLNTEGYTPQDPQAGVSNFWA